MDALNLAPEVHLIARPHHHDSRIQECMQNLLHVQTPIVPLKLTENGCGYIIIRPYTPDSIYLRGTIPQGISINTMEGGGGALGVSACPTKLRYTCMGETSSRLPSCTPAILSHSLP